MGEVEDVIETVRAVATEGLSYATDKYDRARYQKLLDLISKTVAEKLSLPSIDVLRLLLSHWGCITPKVGIEVGVMSLTNEILVLKRSDDGKWGVACGWMDIGESPFDTARREVFEECGFRIRPEGYAAVNTKGPEVGLPHQLNVLVICQRIAKETEIRLCHEHTESRWITRADEVEWHPGHEAIAEVLFRYIENPSSVPLIYP